MFAACVLALLRLLLLLLMVGPATAQGRCWPAPQATAHAFLGTAL